MRSSVEGRGAAGGEAGDALVERGGIDRKQKAVFVPSACPYRPEAVVRGGSWRIVLDAVGSPVGIRRPGHHRGDLVQLRVGVLGEPHHRWNASWAPMPWRSMAAALSHLVDVLRWP
jgi:hypothetical protein